MVSIARHLDEHDIAQEIRFERQVHKGAFLVLEGKTDVKRFDGLMDEIECSIVNAYYRSNAIGAIQMLYDEGFPGAVAVVDADFDRMTGSLLHHEGIIYSQYHDLDLDWINSSVMDKYLTEVGDEQKCQAIGTSSKIIELIEQSLKPLSVLRYLNVVGIVNFRLKDLHIDSFYENFSCDVPKMVDAVYEGRQVAQSDKDALIALVCRHQTVQYDLKQLTNGHDFCAALGIALRNDLASRRIPQTWGSEIEMHLRLTFCRADFLRTQVYAAIIEWQNSNAPYIVARFS